MDKFYYPILLTEKSIIKYNGYGSNPITFTFEVKPGRYYTCRNTPSSNYPSLPDIILDEITSSLDSMGLPSTISALPQTPQYGEIQNTGIDFSPYANADEFFLEDSGQALEALGGAFGTLFSSSNSRNSAKGQWTPPVKASDKRLVLNRESFSSRNDSVQYVNSWTQQKRRKFLYKAVHPTSVIRSPVRYPDDDALNTFGGLRVGDPNNTWQGLWESVEAGDDIIILHEDSTRGNLTWGPEDYEIGRLVATPQFSSTITSFGVPERYNVEFEVQIIESEWSRP